MKLTRMLLLAFASIALVITGCGSGSKTDDASTGKSTSQKSTEQKTVAPKSTEQKTPTVKTTRPDVSKDEFTHVIESDAEYYKVGPQQAQPPDGTFKSGTKITVVEESGSYSLVRSADGTEGYVASGAIRKIDKLTRP